MFKKAVFGIRLLIVLALAAGPVQSAQRIRVTPAFGILWDINSCYYWDDNSVHQSVLWTLGLSVDFPLSKTFTLTPELYFASPEVGFKNFLLQPGLMLNCHLSRFFAGVGVVDEFQARNRWSYEGEGDPRTVVWNVVWSELVKVKLDAGYQFSKIKLTIFFLTPFEDLGWFPSEVNKVYGATIGYTF